MAPTIPTGFPHSVPVTDQPLAAWEDILIFFYMFSYHAQSHLLEFILSNCYHETHPVLQLAFLTCYFLLDLR